MYSQRSQRFLKSSTTQNQSKELIKSFVKTSLYCITFLRNIFDEENYSDEKYSFVETDDRKVKGQINSKILLRGITEKADRFIDIVENILEVIDQQYVAALELRIRSKWGEKKSQEFYMYSFDYTNSCVNFLLHDLDDQQCSDVLDDAIEKVQKTLRKVIMFTQTLAPLIGEKELSFRILFNNECPTSYDLPGFSNHVPLKKSLVEIDFDTVECNIGGINTLYNSLGLVSLSSVENESKGIVQLDPFDLTMEKHRLAESINLERVKTNIEIPRKLSTPQKPLANIKRKIVNLELSTQSKSPKSVPIDIQKTCECGALKDLETIFPRKSYTKLECSSCGRLTHSSCYGFLNYQASRKANDRFICYSCMYPDTLILKEELIFLMRLRFMWKVLVCNNIPKDTSFYYNIFNLVPGRDDAVVTKLLNIYLRDDIFVVQDDKLNSTHKEHNSPSGFILHGLDGIYTSGGECLKKHKHHYLTFAPKIKTSLTKLKVGPIQKLYFPDRANTIDLVEGVLNCLKQQTGPYLKKPEVDDDPIEYTSSEPSAKRLSEVGDLRCVNKRKQSSESESESDVRDYTFQESLNFLSQTLICEDKSFDDVLHEKLDLFGRII